MPLAKIETVKFDPSKKEHRIAVKAFMVRRAWNDASLRFAHEAEFSNGSLADQVQIKLLEYYMEKEKLIVAPRNPNIVNVGTLVIGKDRPM